MTPFEKAYLTLLLAMVIAMALLICTPRSQADDRWPQWDADSSLDHGRCLWAEDTSGKDWPAISHVLVKRWRQHGNRSWRTQVRGYCALFDKTAARWHGTRPDRIRRSTWVEPLDGTEADWKRVRDFVANFQLRKVPDPCPACRHWAGVIDQIPANWTCPLGPPETNNSFCYVQR